MTLRSLNIISSLLFFSAPVYDPPKPLPQDPSCHDPRPPATRKRAFLEPPA
eukprot:CAMPEP_0184480182 /NCGR_PEP_ID=MMETSP0113_2-20130426/1663_1 /TAXON_ID=91329 /ORGANISM="Norrisiella sphaerica, Strain BC52" /LENGTH=50 /DNA_ID=CAMNT_0026858471 /DNA_START=58 /DNA_END=211 /DNA_ORIENTATION=-